MSLHTRLRYGVLKSSARVERSTKILARSISWVGVITQQIVEIGSNFSNSTTIKISKNL